MKAKRQGKTEKFKLLMESLKKTKVHVGFFKEAEYPDGTSIAYVATIHEFGYPQGNIPARPFMRPTIEHQKEEWGKQYAGAIIAAANGHIMLGNAMDQIGAMAAGDIGKTISKLTLPPLKDSTIEARQRKRKSPGVSSKPLVDTGLLIQSVTWEVVEE